MSPFFLKQYVKSHAHDVFEAYPQLLTEMALRLPYQYFKVKFKKIFYLFFEAKFTQEANF